MTDWYFNCPECDLANRKSIAVQVYLVGYKGKASIHAILECGHVIDLMMVLSETLGRNKV